MNGYQRVKEKKKAAIKNGAFSLFAERGVKDVKIEDIAATAGVSQVTIYNHFGSKENLLSEVIKEYILEKYEEFKAMLLDKKTFKEKIEAIIFMKIEAARLHPDTIAAMLKESNLNAFLQQFQEERFIPLLIDMFDEAQKNGEVNPAISNEMLLFYLDIFRNFPQEKFMALMRGDKIQHTKEIMQLFFYGLSVPPENK
ncbi:TetR family transcriptional regulator [Scopulibacillus darangshiensis]|uniref:TetR family transcriptional regulator n=1 Tax=Scopulibacillus darangshiensis TaxID=442528 RepID=A0A4V2SN39_9BACL|nr:TetR/AcrR family transcriptional regulator [Scopulibacillus darangshiensis]TCP29786.1 TetR family transcriptional regulator [Scopulibacillus darangshiensis]